MKIIFSILLLFSFRADAQLQPTILSLLGIGGNIADDISPIVTKTADGGFIVRLETNSDVGTGNIDSFCSSTNEREIFIKYNADATAIKWSGCYGFGGDSFLLYMFPTMDGGRVLGGAFNSSSGWGFLISKQDAVDNVLWQKNYSKGNNAIPDGMITTNDGGYIVMGTCTYTDTNIQTHYGSMMDNDIWIMKVDSIGNKVWCKVIGGSDNEEAYTIVNGPGDGCYILGTTRSSDHDCTGYKGGQDVYLARLDKDGNILWHRDLGGSDVDGYFEWGVSDEKGGLIIAAGSKSGDGDVHHAIGDFDYWLVSIDSSGNILRDNSYGSMGAEFPTAVCKATDGSIWITGESFGAGGQIATVYGNGDAWIIHADSVGNFMSSIGLGSSSSDEGKMIYPLVGDAIITGGFYGNNSNSFISLNLYNTVPAYDVFLAIFAPWTTEVPEAPLLTNGFTIYPNPANSLVTIAGSLLNDGKIVVSDALGRIVYSCEPVGSSVRIDVSTWAKGVYFVHGGGEVNKVVVY